MRYVVDCSVALKWYFQEPLSDVALTVLRRFQAGALDLVAPDCLVPELGHSLRKLVLGGKVSYEDASSALGDFGALPIPLVPSMALSGQALELAVTHMATFYDALYLSLAIREDCPVLTADGQRLQQTEPHAVPGQPLGFPPSPSSARLPGAQPSATARTAGRAQPPLPLRRKRLDQQQANQDVDGEAS